MYFPPRPAHWTPSVPVISGIWSPGNWLWLIKTESVPSERTAAENGYRYQNFLTGLSGDYLAVSENNTKDLYAISSDVFDTIYQKVE